MKSDNFLALNGLTEVTLILVNKHLIQENSRNSYWIVVRLRLLAQAKCISVTAQYDVTFRDRRYGYCQLRIAFCQVMQ